ncbi:piggyBac transposable element-derived protein 4-like [Belonocnema kinseyi]|uniref:piggyBac transposable element-derived protein 4-like n=1 Tax=Belonocnema kinseyi TaxID=2817044 RepID=UPI00143CDFB4|nr:piggyBac transposable element-derived protein 4-like [Belonocnema kinseyi]
MTIKRFSFLLSHLHLNDDSREPKRNETGYDKLYKVKPVLNILYETYTHFYNPTVNQSIDESMIKFKGRSSMKQYMPMNPIKRGYKVWVKADENGYVCEFHIYTGKVGNKTENLLGERVVKDVNRTLVHKKYRIFFDNFFTTVNLMSSLLTDWIFACGTVGKDRKDLPKKQCSEKNMSSGESQFRNSYKGVRCLKWIVKTAISFLSNYHDSSVILQVTRRQKDGSLKVVTFPQMAKDYNSYMGCVDKADMLYEISRKSKKWFHRLFWYFVDVTIVNAFILYKLLFPEKTFLLKDFRLSVVDHMIGVPNRAKSGRPVTEPSLKPKKLGL